VPLATPARRANVVEPRGGKSARGKFLERGGQDGFAPGVAAAVVALIAHARLRRDVLAHAEAALPPAASIAIAADHVALVIAL